MKNTPLALARLDITQIDSIVFGGGGNRCFWQAGAVSFLLEHGWQLPRQFVGTSGGAGIATACITEGPHAALDSCLSLYGSNERTFEWGDLARLKFRFAHQHIYPAWIESFLNKNNFAKALASGTRLTVGFARPAKALGLTGSVLAGTLSYLIDTYIWHSIYPPLPKLLGLQQDFVDLQQCQTITEAQILLTAAAAAPPLIHAQQIGGAIAIDGGYVNNAPTLHQSDKEKQKTLVLLTGHYPGLPRLFILNGRNYWQPSQAVPVSTWDCTRRTTVSDAFSLGERDAACAFHGHHLHGA